MPNHIFIVEVNIFFFVIDLFISVFSWLGLGFDRNKFIWKHFQEEGVWNYKITVTLHASFKDTLRSIIFDDLLKVLLPS
jgi:hypothetical protein